ncbi:DUF5691 domain-containing protein [Actinomadura sp. WMMB 499]|uniref:DUF5691 domain-containing protein n=1 Tax=Actinomadura sp. WMMB 499 TaxID=1219491 RepID=UPI0012451274|nr:DUF5691 domain-containing protein [Actinomadura sp. WMMB 499]QFG20571.1 hypothetical protein F7P10_04805 [Actinomadura sp. WMMB 499]
MSGAVERGAVSAWDEHVTAALLGTERRDPPALNGEPAGEPDGDRGGDGAAGRLLDQAALLTVRWRAGFAPVPSGGLVPVAPAPVEHDPAVPDAAAARLARILAGEQIRVLPEWLDAAAGRGLRVPPRLLPALLERGRSDRMLRPSIARAAGRRGMWLALQNTDWAYLVGAGPVRSGDDPAGAEAWRSGTRHRRVAYLSGLRGADPAAARELLRETWDREPAPDRAAFLGTFAWGLSLADEEFLEAALDDRGKDVRQLAADLLARLPGAAYGDRMAERARACLIRRTGPPPGAAATAPERDRPGSAGAGTPPPHPNPTAPAAGAPPARGPGSPPDAAAPAGPAAHAPETGGAWIEVEAPGEHDAGLARDGVPFHPGGSFAPRPGNGPVGTRVAWLREILARTPLSTWTSAFGLPPAAIVRLPVPGGAGDPHTGWARAALNQRDAEWARALIEAGAVADEPEALADLLDVLPEGERDAAAAALVRRVPDRGDPLRLLERVPGPWAGPLASAVVAILASAAGRPTRAAEHTLTRLCRVADLRLDPAAAARLAEHPVRPLPRPLTDLIDTLRFRDEMLKELS